MDFKKVTNYDLNDTYALTSATSEADSREILLLAPQIISGEEPPLDFQILVA